MTIKAIYQNGVFRPTETVHLPEGAKVEVQVRPTVDQQPRGTDSQVMAAFFAKLAAMPLQPGGEEFSNRDHDRILYGWKNKQ